ncbi:uracil-DNA glycosylase [Rubellimicrobium aerolatum]|uniref:Type-4 uracil-DNA glycosylase n=1 Tax=Rubellimicrobium aerolatum TaxID=490979 RepID=A0ABW0SCY9_9RHOB|nr:uracil-DNA glycosylase [Rubellimicrobium aerolatum]MBP1806600.1 DNA polymerase [Rubellimicrobium aerolatum]
MDPALLSARAALDWLVELGADEAIGEAPVDRYGLVARTPADTPTPAPLAAPPVVAPSDPVAVAEALAQGARDLSALAAAMEGFDCDLKPGARRFVFADGTPGAALMVVGEAPGRDEDIEGRPFVGVAGQLLDRMLAAIGRDRADADPARAVYVANVLPWRPPGNRRPEGAEIDRWRPFLVRHVELAAPKVLLVMGNSPAQALLGRSGITQIRGRWAEAAGRPALPTFHPSYLLRTPAAKREAWADLLALKARLDHP